MKKGIYIFKEYGLLIAGLLLGFWFFFGFPNQHPISTVQNDFTDEQLYQKLDSVLISWRHTTFGGRKIVSLQEKSSALDSLQHKVGRPNIIQKINQARSPHVPFFYWVVEQKSDTGEFTSFVNNQQNAYWLSFSEDGQVVGFQASPKMIKETGYVNRAAIRSVFNEDINKAVVNEDSVLSLLIDYQEADENSDEIANEMNMIKGLRSLLDSPSAISREDMIWKIADFYIKQTFWRNLNLRRDTLVAKEEEGIRVAEVSYSATDTLFNTRPEISVQVLPAGGIKSLSYTIPGGVDPQEELFNYRETAILGLAGFFFFWMIIAFYQRIKARAIDTKTAMVVAVVAGFAFMVINALSFLHQFGVTTEGISFSSFFNQTFQLGLNGAFSALAFFILTTVGDSMARQYDPDCLRAWDLLRRANFKNKLVGNAVLHGVAIGFVVLGVWTLLLHFFPNVYISDIADLLSEEYVLAFAANINQSLLITLLITLTIFFIVANQVIALTRRKWLIPVISALLFAVVFPFQLDIGPFGPMTIFGGVCGFLFGLFFISFDLLSVIIGLFVFIASINSVNGWLIENSPDAFVFYSVMGISIFLIGFAIYAIRKGQSIQDLPTYTPEYIEEQAKEERVKQELTIARIVQKTFLPSQIQKMKGIDIAGICEPAQETGGDYYDMIPLGDQRMAVAIGDVSGKGIRAAFYMTFTKGVLHSLSAIILSPLELLNQLNRLFNENATRGTFITMIYGMLDARKREFIFSRAGHNSMLHMKADGEARWLKPKGVGIGLLKDDSFVKCTEEVTVQLDEGDLIVLYTDGITEMQNTGDKFYGEERLEKLVRGIRNGSSQKILQIIIDDVNTFKGIAKQHDDMTLVIIKVDKTVNQ